MVLSLQSLKEAARTSIVSRKWREVWTRCPNLCFDGTEDGPTDEDCVKIKEAKFIETVNSVIQKHTGTRLNKFSIRCYLEKNCSDHLDRWVYFATASKAAKIIDMNLGLQSKDIGPTKEVYHFPLEVLDGQDGPFVQSLFLTNVSIKPHSDICGFKKLGKLHLHCAQIIGDLPELLLNCPILEDLELIACSGVADPLDKLRHFLICNMSLKMVDFHVTGLTHFGYQGCVIPIVLHGCSNLEKVTITFFRMPLAEQVSNKGFVHAITGIIPSISAVKELHVCASMREYNPVWLWSLQVPSVHHCLAHSSNDLLVFIIACFGHVSGAWDDKADMHACKFEETDL